MFFEFFYPEKIDLSEHAVVLKDWPLKPFLNRPYEGGQIHKYTLCSISVDEEGCKIILKSLFQSHFCSRLNLC